MHSCAHTHTHMHTPKTPVVNKDAHGNLLPQFTYSPQTSSSGPNPHPISTLGLVHTDGCVLSHSTHSHTQMLTLRFTPSHACAHRPSPTKGEGRQIHSPRAPCASSSPIPAPVFCAQDSGAPRGTPSPHSGFCKCLGEAPAKVGYGCLSLCGEVARGVCDACVG